MDQSSFQVIVDDSNIVVHDMEITIIMGCTIFTQYLYQIEALTFIDVLEYIRIILVIKRKNMGCGVTLWPCHLH